MYTRTLLARTAALLTLLLAACDAGRPAVAPLPLTIAVFRQPAAALVFVADEQGYFREEGVAVALDAFDLGRDALASALAGRADLATVFDAPVVRRLAAGDDIALLATLHHSVNSHAILARRDRGIARPADLRGKRIGVTKGISTDYFLSVFLTSEGIPAAAVTEVPLEPENYEKALLGGAVDALVTFNPLTFKLRDALGAERSAIFHSDLYRETSVLAGRREIVAARREAVTRALRALVRAEDYLRDHPEDALRIVVARLAGRYPEAVVRESWGAFRAEARLDNMLLTQFVQQGYWLREHEGQQASLPDFERALASEYLEAVRPRAVTVLHGAR
jgi:NitT/TauT family transport system substrate-binding protein